MSDQTVIRKAAGSDIPAGDEGPRCRGRTAAAPGGPGGGARVRKIRVVGSGLERTGH